MRVLFAVISLVSFPVIWADQCFVTNALVAGEINEDDVDEASGLAAGRRTRGILFTHNDSGDSARIFAFFDDGEPVGE